MSEVPLWGGGLFLKSEVPLYLIYIYMYRGTSPIRKRPPPEDPPRTLQA